MKIKHIIGGVLVTAGMLAALGSVGHLDCLDACGERYGAAEVKEMIVKSAGGLAAAFVGAILCQGVKVEESKISADKPRSEEKENRAD